MSYKCSFVDEVLYGPEDVNEVVGDLVGAGVAPFISKDSYNPSDLNSLTADMVISGVQLGGCIVSRVSDAVVSVAPGIIYFGNGLRLKVTEAHSVTVPENEEVTIYARYIPSLGTGELAHTTLTITKDDYNIPLALISADGTIKDAREFAESKITTLGTNSVYIIPDDRITIYEDKDKAPYYNDEKIVAEIDLSDVNLNKFNYLYFMYCDTDDGNYYVHEIAWEFKKVPKRSIRRIWAGNVSKPETYEEVFDDTCIGSANFVRDFNKILVVYKGNYYSDAVYDVKSAKKYKMKLI